MLGAKTRKVPSNNVGLAMQYTMTSHSNHGGRKCQGYNKKQVGN